jgi:hypothetical protein
MPTRPSPKAKSGARPAAPTKPSTASAAVKASGRAASPAPTLRARGPDRLPENRRSKTEEAMERRLDTLDPGTPRYDTLAAAIEFKRSWVQLAERLSGVEKAGEYKAWGYRTFEAYAQHELHMRRDTVSKLLKSYGFLSTYEPRLLEDLEQKGEPVAMPSYQALDVLAEARANPYLSERDYRELRDHVFREDPTPAQIRKTVREKAPEPVKKEAIDPSERHRKALALAERLYGLLVEADDLPERVTQAMEDVVGGLRQVLEE